MKKTSILQTFVSIPVSKTDKLSGWVLYPLADGIAQLILGDISYLRMLFVALLGRYVYAIEIPKWFGLLSVWHRSTAPGRFLKNFWVKTGNHYYFNWLSKTIGATLWFNPLWIARHMLVLELADMVTGKTVFFSFLPQALHLGTVAFIGQLPLAFGVNYIIICRLPERSRFIWSSIFSGILAIYYAVGKVYF